MSLNKFEKGQVLRANLGQDVSTNIGLRFVLQPKAGEPENATDTDNYPNAIVRTGADVTVGTADVVVGDETYLANEYVEYTTKANDLSLSGLWRIKGEADITSIQTVIGDYRNITVLD